MLNQIVTLGLALLLGYQGAPDGGRIYGRALTVDGARFEGYLRWDRNEASWTDLLDGQKEIPWENVREIEAIDEEFRARRERERSISLPGLRISWEEDDGEPRSSVSAVRFGHLRSLRVVDDRRAVLTLRSGEEVELRGGSTDIGRSFRGLVVEDRERGAVDVRWRDLDRIDFTAAPPGSPPPVAGRLFGALRTRRGVELRGYVAWDLDEALTTDVLDGEEDGREHEVPFGSVAAIERDGARASRVTLIDGRELVLSRSNDVDSDNRGIEISDPALGRATVAWDEFESIVFQTPATAPNAGDSAPGAGTSRVREAFDGGRPLVGTAVTRTGRSHTGRIRWDNDEAFTWEMLDGRADGVDYAIELGLVRSIEPVDASAARVRLRDGRTLLLAGSNDVNDDNEGILVHGDGGVAVWIRWRDLQRVTFRP